MREGYDEAYTPFIFWARELKEELGGADNRKWAVVLLSGLVDGLREKRKT